MILDHEGIVGVDFKGTLGVGFWFEGVVHLPAGAEPYEEFATGIDYSFPVLEQLVLTAQVYRNGAGSREPTTSLFEAPQPFAPVFRGRDYGMASVMAGLTRDVSLSTLWIQNLDDGTAYVVPSLFTLPTGSMEISLAAQIPIAFSGGGEFKPAPRQLRVNLPTADGSVTRVDLAGLVPDATLILWTRLNF